MTSTTRRATPLLLFLLLFAACGDEPTRRAPVIETLVLSPTSETLTVGEQLQITAVALDESGEEVLNPEIDWSSSAPDVLIVSEEGLVSARSPGSATVVARAPSGATGRADFLVTSATATSCSPSSAISLAVGSSVDLSGAATRRLCLQGGAEYLLVPFYASENGEARVRLDLRGGEITGVVGPPNPSLQSTQFNETYPHLDEAWEVAHRQREFRDLGGSLSLARAALQSEASRALAQVAPTVGQRLRLNTSASCSNPVFHTGRVMAVTRHAIVVADSANPSGGLTAEDFRSLGIAYDTLAHPVNVENFGEPTDIDDNDRVILFYTRAVNDLTPPGSDSFVGGFFWAGDLFPRAQCAGSNFAEIFYLLAPDPSGVLGNVRPLDFIRQSSVSTLAHELQHLINASRRIYVHDAPVLEEVWLNEGLSHIAEELLFYRAAGLSPGQNLTATEITATQARTDAANRYLISNLGRYRQYLLRPDTVSLLGLDDLPTRGASWAFLRYAADHTPSDDAQFFNALVNSTTSGLANLSRVLPGDPPIRWMQRWSTSVYADDAVPGITALHTQPSWHFRSIIPLISSGIFPLRTIVLQNERTFSLELKAGGAAFIRFGVASGSTSPLEITSGGADAPDLLRTTLLRTR